MRMVRHCVACAYGFAVRGMCVVRQYVACKWLGCTSHVYCLTVRGMCVVWQLLACSMLGSGVLCF